MHDLPRTMAGLQREIAAGRLSAREALAWQRQRVAPMNGVLGCVVSVPAEPTPDERPEGPLAGIGLAHKDIFDTADHRPGLGRDRGGPAPGRRAARAIESLRRRGASHLARLAMAEHACGATGANPHLPPCVNPRRAQAVVGGSSSGSAVAVAAGLVYGSLGTDTAGSVRIPAAACGVMGLKTTHGLVSREGVMPLAPSLDSVGLLARCADDLGQMLDAVAQAPLAPAAGHEPRVRVWIPASLDDAVAEAMRQCLAVVGGPVIDTEVLEHPRLSELAEALLAFEAAQVHRQALLAGQTSPAVEAVCLPGLAVAPDWAAAVRAQRASQLQAFVANHFRDADLLLLPALATPVPDWAQVTPDQSGFDARRLVGLYRYMGFVNYLGLPALVLPVATDARGMPISVQVLARPFQERNLLAWASRVEQRLFGAQGIPPVYPPLN